MFDSQRLWYQSSKVAPLLLPFAWLYQGVVKLHRNLYRWKLKKTTHFKVPVIVVGNLTVGGTGKTPFVAWLVQWLQARGYQPGIVSRGYGGRAKQWPQVVNANSDPQLVGDEPVMLAQQVRCPIVVAPDRVAAVKQLLTDYQCDIVVSDDGLQHHALGRQIEIVVIDGERRFGNGYCLPAGPLREPKQRLQQVDFIISNGAALAGEYAMQLVAGDFYQLTNPANKMTAKQLQGQTIHAVAAIGHPARFFKQLTKLGLNIKAHPFPDHYFFKATDLDFADNGLVVMTAKDAIKCQNIAQAQHWCLPVYAEVDPTFGEQFAQCLDRGRMQQSS